MILLIDNYDSFTYNLYQLLAIDHPEIVVARNDKISLAEIHALKPAGIVLSPGPGRPEEAGICVPLIQALLKKDFSFSIPLLGVCLGHQALAFACNANIIHADHIAHAKQDAIYHHHHALYADLPSPFIAGRYHSLLVERDSLPAVLTVDAENEEKIVMGIRHVDLPLFGVQFHPESILTPAGHQLIKKFIKITEENQSHAIKKKH